MSREVGVGGECVHEGMTRNVRSDCRVTSTKRQQKGESGVGDKQGKEERKGRVTVKKKKLKSSFECF